MTVFLLSQAAVNSDPESWFKVIVASGSTTALLVILITRLFGTLDRMDQKHEKASERSLRAQELNAETSLLLTSTLNQFVNSSWVTEKAQELKERLTDDRKARENKP